MDIDEKNIEDAYKYLCEEILPKIDNPISYERFRHLVYEGKIDLSSKNLPDPNCLWDGQEEIAQKLGVDVATYRRWKRRYPDLASDRIYEGARREFMCANSGYWWKEKHDRQVKTIKLENLKGKKHTRVNHGY